MKKVNFFSILKSLKKGVGSGFVCQRYESADPDPHQTVTDPQHCCPEGWMGLGFWKQKKDLAHHTPAITTTGRFLLFAHHLKAITTTEEVFAAVYSLPELDPGRWGQYAWGRRPGWRVGPPGCRRRSRQTSASPGKAARPAASPQTRVGNKKPTQKNPPKKPTKNVVFFVFWGFFIIFYKNNTNFSLWNLYFYEQIRHKLSFIYKKIVRYALN